ncbi:MAG: DUF3800 domain-containing protein, partial [Methylobacteriaceae bacterium]|nr:DUF3800 domain-containing protein [Methylobacteriaceae bacterium]
MTCSASDHIRALVSGYDARVRARKLLVALQAYVDDSASDQGKRDLVLAGYVNTADKWAEFSHAWASELKRAPSIAYLKMREARNLSGEFKGWRSEDRDAKVQALARIIRETGPASIHSRVSRNDVDRMIKPVAPYAMRTPYFYCFQAILLPIAIHQNRSNDVRVPIDFIFDNQEGLGDEARNLYKLIRLQQPSEIRDLLSFDPIFRDDKLVNPLQAADMIAWYIRKFYEDNCEGSVPVPDFLASGRPHMAVDIDAGTLQRIADGFRAIPGTVDL